MKNVKKERRKQKLVKRDRRQKAFRAEIARRSEFPEIVISDTHANQSFAKIVREAVMKFDYNQLPELDQDIYRRMRSVGVEAALIALKRSMARLRASQPDNPLGQLADFNWAIRTGEMILRNISENDRHIHFPMNDFRIVGKGRRLHVQCVSLVQVRTNRGRAFHSRFRPTVEFQGKKYIVAFTHSVIEKLHRRLKQKRMTYAALGDIYGFFEQCRHFEPCRIRGDGERRDESVEAISFFDNCDNQRMWNHFYVKEVLGDNYDRSKGTPYHRVGYCPVVLEGDYALATSFLPPGFAKTPEHDTIRLANLPYSEKERLREMATSDDALLRLCKDCDFSAVRHFHESGIPQVVQSHEEWFLPYDV